MNTKMKLGIVAAMALIGCIAIWWGVRDASWWAVATLVAVGFIGGLAVGANNADKVDKWKGEVENAYKRMDG